MPTPTIKMAPADWLWIGVLSIMWGSSFIYIKVALDAFPPFTLVAARLAVSAAVLIVWLAATHRIVWPTRAQAGAIAVMGLFNVAVPFCLLTYGQGGLSAGLASIFNATTPLFSILISHLWSDDDKITWSRLGALVIGFGGVVVLMGGVSGDGSAIDLPSGFAVLAAAVFYASAAVYGRKIARLGIQPATASAGQFVVALIVLTPLSLLIDQPWTLPAPGLGAIAAIVALGAVNSAIGYIIYYRVLARSGATNVSLVTLLVPVSAIVLGIILLDESISGPQSAGIALIFVGLAVADGRLAGLLARTRPTA